MRRFALRLVSGTPLAQPPSREYRCGVRTPARLLLAVFLGGAVGTLARLSLGSFVATFAIPQGSANLAELSAGSLHVLDSDILAALIANLAGSLALGIVAGAHWPPHRAAWRAALGPGFCGGFTTFSLIALALALAFSTSAWAVTALVIGTIGGIAAVFLGRALGRRISPPPAAAPPGAGPSGPGPGTGPGTAPVRDPYAPSDEAFGPDGLTPMGGAR